MSTRFRVGFCDPESGKVVSIAGHWDGYPSHIGAWLVERHGSLASARELVRGHKGLYSVRGNRVVDMDRDTRRVDEDIVAFARKDSDIGEYGYLFAGDSWYWIDGWKIDELSGSRTLHRLDAEAVAAGLPDGDAHSTPFHV